MRMSARPALLAALAVLLSALPLTAHAGSRETAASRRPVPADTPVTVRWRPRAVPLGLTRADLLSAYDVTPLGSGAGVTIATVQFAGWRQSDLQTYATAAGLAMPVIEEVIALDGSATPADVLPDLEGEFEVALDQQALLVAAPDATQRIYFAGNSDAAAIDVYTRLADDTEAGLVDVVSLTWGICELDIATETRAAIEASLARIVAAGRTVFAASGDLGAYGCVDSEHVDELSTDYPGSSEHVVSVGGTRLSRSSSWSEVAWSQPLSEDEPALATGGGFSAFVARPAWQPATTSDDPAGDAPKKRMVPDIAATADQHTGLGVYVASAGGWNLGGGTSLASAVTAGHFAATLSAAGRTDGLGAPLHPLLYANPSALRDVTSGSNFGYQARAGYDLATGLGSPLWNRVHSLITGAPVVAAPSVSNSTTIPLTITPPAGTTYTKYQICKNDLELTCTTAELETLPAQPTVDVAGSTGTVRVVVVGWDAGGVAHPGVAYTLLDLTAPTASAAVRFTSPTATRATFSWAGSDGAGSGIARYHAKITKAGLSTPVLDYHGLTRSHTRTLAQGGVYTLTVRTEDRAGNLSTPAVTRIVTPYDQTAFYRSTGWRKGTHSANFLGSTLYSATRGRWVSKTVYGDSIDLMVTTGPTGGYVNVYVNGRYLRRVSTYSSSTKYRKLIRVATWTRNGSRKVKLVVAGSRVRASRGNTIKLDGMRVNRR
jgi:hypothetical protein